ncbi:MAG: hypothetical protein CR991_09735 [Proteobacteria bacterium]|nr:MAG: hypothetical protein CR991_09735 [Pseudomonadota bacterium]
MTKKFAYPVFAALLASTLTLTGCTGTTNAQTGAMVGSVLGGVAGHQFGKGDGKVAATIAGTLLGQYIGSQIGAQWDIQDQHYLSNSLQSGRQVSWQNPNTGYRYIATPGPARQVVYQGQATVCRPATVVAVIDGRQQNVQMNACRGPSGQWQATN